MKYILSENQVDKIPSDKLADIFFGWFSRKYPDYQRLPLSDLNDKDMIVSKSDDGLENIIHFYFDEDDDFYVSIYLVELFFNRLGIESFDHSSIANNPSPARTKFDNIMRIFAKKNFGRKVHNVYLHFLDTIESDGW